MESPQDQHGELLRREAPSAASAQSQLCSDIIMKSVTGATTAPTWVSDSVDERLNMLH